jgi:hypothetical protein
VGELNRHGHQLLGLVRCVAEHHALIAGASRVDSLRYVRRLLVDCADDGARLRIESVAGVVVANPLDRGAHDLRNVDVCLGGDLAGDTGEASGYESLTGDAREGIIGENCIEDGIRYRVRNLVGVTLGYGFGREQMSIEHEIPLGELRMSGGSGRTPYYSCAED